MDLENKAEVKTGDEITFLITAALKDLGIFTRYLSAFGNICLKKYVCKISCTQTLLILKRKVL